MCHTIGERKINGTRAILMVGKPTDPEGHRGYHVHINGGTAALPAEIDSNFDAALWFTQNHPTLEAHP